MAEDAGLGEVTEVELADDHVVPSLLRLRFGKADACHLGIAVRGAGNAVVVDGVEVLAREDLGHADAFGRRHVRQLRMRLAIDGDEIADRVDPRLVGLVAIVDAHKAALHAHPGRFEAEPVGHGAAADGHKEEFGDERLPVTGSERDLDLHAVRNDRGRLCLGASEDGHVLRKMLFRFLRDLLVFEGQDSRQHLDDRDRGSKTPEDGRELDSHRTRADDDQALGHLLQFEDLVRGDDPLPVDREVGEAPRLAAGREHDVLGGNPRRPGFARHEHGVRVLDPPLTLHESDLVLLEEVPLYALGQPVHDPVLPGHEGGEIDPHVLGKDAEVLAVLQILVEVRGVKQRLGGDATALKAGAAGALGVALHHGHFEPQLRGANGAHVPSRAASNNGEIELVRQDVLASLFGHGHYHEASPDKLTSPMTTSLDRILATLNSTEVGSIDRIVEKMRLAATDLRAIEQPELAKKAEESVEALGRADVAEFKRLRAFIQSKVGHLR